MDLTKFTLKHLESDVLIRLLKDVTREMLTVTWPHSRSEEERTNAQQLHDLLLSIGCDRHQGLAFVEAEQKVRAEMKACREENGSLLGVIETRTSQHGERPL